MSFAAKLAAAKRSQPVPNRRPTALDLAQLPDSDSGATTLAIRQAEAEAAIAGDSQREAKLAKFAEGVAEAERTAMGGLSTLVDDNFPFDESQLAAIEGLASVNRGCLTGAAGTGKTTTLKAVVQRLKSETRIVDMESYWVNKNKTEGTPAGGDDSNDGYDSSRKRIPSICLCAFTGRATEQIRANFPLDWHSNIMTIHRMLGFYPEYEEVTEWDEESQAFFEKKKMTFVPLYDSTYKLPWDIIVMDESGMTDVLLWEKVRCALKPTARVYLIGDINQLPPVHGRSIFGFAMAEWKTFELTHVHRQKGVNNSIVDNAWQVINGRALLPDNPKTLTFDTSDMQQVVDSLNWMLEEPDWKFAAIRFPGLARPASVRTRQILKLLADNGFYDPIRDTTITPINGEDGSRGYDLGQMPMNRELALMFNGSDNRYIIDGGIEHKYFAVGDKVMATKNDHEQGITNGMTGIITKIERHDGYAGVVNRFGLIEDVNAWLADNGDDEVHVDIAAIRSSIAAVRQGKEDAKERRDRGPASHHVTVAFGKGDNAREIKFSTLSEVGSLMTAYVVTCHKMQGGEAPVIFILCHDSHASMLYREWLYTAITRASQRCVLLFTDRALNACLRKQKIKGKNLAEKVESFRAFAAAAVKNDTDNQVRLDW